MSDYGLSASFIDDYGCDVFGVEEIRGRLSEESFAKFIKSMQEGHELTPGIADEVAEAMKAWAVERGATHYTHWFQPLTGSTAEKQDSFLEISGGRELLNFSGKNLIRGESDASSFPSGGLRATFEARGYTAWDCTSPAFIRKDALGVTLCIPTVFCSYTGESLDHKTPLLRSMQAIDTQAVRILRLFGNETSRRVIPMVGAEQEYFLVDKRVHDIRKDLVYTGRTLFGSMAPKGQELDDHYFGVINEKVGAYMKDLNHELWQLGVPAKTQHNEVAPSQHELAPIYEQANIATDHNQITMEVMKKIAERHGLVCLLHEKPFKGVNGSGKHNNWSLETDDGINFFKPGDEPDKNLLFLLSVACMLRAVDRHADLLRFAAANVGNDLRLGGDEAPPAIVSVYLGEQIEDIFEQMSSGRDVTGVKRGRNLQTGVASLPDFEMDAADRNRTSPVAFTGNKFEFRMVGSSDSIAEANVVLNTIMAESFRDAADELEKAEDFDTALRELIVRYYKEHKRIIFDGDGYSAEWVAEAARRGLPNLPSMVDAIPALTTDKAVTLFEDFGVLTRDELTSRREIEFDLYAKEVNIEARTMLEITGKRILPAIIRYIGKVAGSMENIMDAVPEADVSVEREMVMECSRLLTETRAAYGQLDLAVKGAALMRDVEERAKEYHRSVFPAMAQLRQPIDHLEVMVDKSLWPLPSYGDLINE